MSTIAMDKMIMGFDRGKQLIIISPKSEEIADRILREVLRGLTFFHGMGGFCRQDVKVIYCVVKNSQVVKVREIVESVDPSAFVTMSEVSEVVG